MRAFWKKRIVKRRKRMMICICATHFIVQTVIEMLACRKRQLNGIKPHWETIIGTKKNTLVVYTCITNTVKLANKKRVCITWWNRLDMIVRDWNAPTS